MSAPPPYATDQPPQQGYPPPQQGYPAQPAAAYPPQQQAGYPPQQQPGYPPQQQAAYPPQQQGYAEQPPPVQQQTVNTTVVTTQPQVVSQPHFGAYPVVVTLANGQQVQTRLSYRSGTMTWLVCAGIFLVLCLFTGFFGVIGIVAFCIDDLKDVYHLDPAGNVVGVYKRI